MLNATKDTAAKSYSLQNKNGAGKNLRYLPNRPSCNVITSPLTRGFSHCQCNFSLFQSPVALIYALQNARLHHISLQWCRDPSLPLGSSTSLSGFHHFCKWFSAEREPERVPFAAFICRWRASVMETDIVGPKGWLNPSSWSVSCTPLMNRKHNLLLNYSLLRVL